MDRIFVSDLQIPCIIGIHEWERVVPQTVRIDLELATDVRRAASMDRIDGATDYKAISKRVITLVSESSFALIETLAEAVAAACLAETDLGWVKVRASKPGAIRGSRDVGIEIERYRGGRSGGTMVLLGIGSNVEPRVNVANTLVWLQRRFSEVRVSPIYESAASGGPAGQPNFFNLVVECTSAHDPFGTTAELRAIEDRLGRKRSADRFAPRTCDIDLLDHGGFTGESLGIRLPHRQVLEEAFVYVPLLDLVPDYVHPLHLRPLAELVNRESTNLRRVLDFNS